MGKLKKLMNYLQILTKSGIPQQLIGIPVYRIIKQIWINLELGEPETIFPQALENQIISMFMQMAMPQQPQQQNVVQNQTNPDQVEKKMNGELKGQGNI